MGQQGLKDVPSSPGLQVFRVNLATGIRTLWHEFAPLADSGMVEDLYYLTLTPDERANAYSFYTVQGDLYLVTGLE